MTAKQLLKAKYRTQIFSGKKLLDICQRIERGGIPVIQYTKDGLFVRVWKHAAIAGHTLKISPSSITECCRGKRKTIGGYIWKYQNDVKH